MPDKKENTSEYALKQVQTTNTLPSAGSSDVGVAVLALYDYAKEAYLRWWKAGNIDREYYRGEQLGKIPKFKSKIVDNQMIPVVNTMKPNIIDNLFGVDIGATRKDDIERAKELNQRVKFAKKSSHFEQEINPIIHNVLVDGGAILKCFESVTVHQIDSRRVMREPESDDFNSSLYIIDTTLATVGAVIDEFGKKAKDLEASESELEGNVEAPKGPSAPGDDSSSVISTTHAPIEGTSPVLRYSGRVSSDSFTKSDRVRLIELWIHDQSKDKAGKLNYPHGRVVNIGVGMKSGARTNPESPEVVVLLDRPNQFETLYEKTKHLTENERGRFPFVQILCYPTSDIWSDGVIRQLRPLQDGLNRLWNRMMDNIEAVIDPKKIISAQSGLKSKQMTNAPGEEIYLPASYIGSARDAIVFTEIPPIINQMMPTIDKIKDTIREVSGVLDVTRGERPGGVTAASAIKLLQIKADNQTLLTGNDISQKLAEVDENLGYIAQDFDEEQMEFPDESVRDREEFIDYDPQNTKDLTIRVMAKPKLGAAEIIEIVMAVAQAEEMLPGSGEMILTDDRYFELRDLFLEAQKQRQIAGEQAKKDELAFGIATAAMGQRNQRQGGGSAVQKPSAA